MSRAGIEAGRAVIRIYVEDKVSQSLKSMQSRLQKFSYAINDLGGIALRGGLVGSIASGYLSKKFLDFEDRILAIRAVLGYFDKDNIKQNATMQDLETTIRMLGKTTSFTSIQVADAAYSLSQAGFSADELKKSLQPILDLARGTGYELGAAADLVANAIRNFNLSASDAGNIVSMLVKATNLGTISIEDLRESLVYASGSAESLGVALPTLLGFFVQMSESGLKASLAGTSLNTALLNMIKNSHKLRAANPNFKITTDAKGNTDLLATMTAVLDMTKEMSKEGRVGFLSDVFNIRGGRMVFSVKEIERVDDYIQKIRMAGTTGRDAARLMDSGLGGAVRRTTSALDELGLKIGETNKKFQQAALSVMPGVIDYLSKLIDKFPLLTVVISHLPYVLVGLGVGLIGLAFTLNRISLVLRAVTKQFKSLLSISKSGISGLAGGLGAGLKTIYDPKKAAALLKLKTKIADQESRLLLATPGTKKAGKLATSLAANRAKLPAVRGPKFAGVKSLMSEMERNRELTDEKQFYHKKAKAYDTFAKASVAKQRKFTTLARIKEAKTAGSGALDIQTAVAAKKQAATYSAAAKTAKALGGSKIAASGANAARTLSIGIRGVVLATKNLLQFGFTIARVGFSIGRFVMSLNPLGLAFNILLLFGHKIPFVVNSFKALSKGFSDAGSQIAKIGTLIGPSLSLFSAGISQLFEGDTAAGIATITTGFSTLASIIKNQLLVAWYSFKLAIAPGLDFINQVLVGTISMFDMLIETISQVGGAILGDAMTPIRDFFSIFMSGKEMNWTGLAESLIKGVIVSIGIIGQTILDVKDFMWDWQASLIKGMMEIVDHLPGTYGISGKGGAIERHDNQVKERQDRSATAKTEIEAKTLELTNALAGAFKPTALQYNLQQGNKALTEVNKALQEAKDALAALRSTIKSPTPPEKVEIQERIAQVQNKSQPVMEQNNRIVESLVGNSSIIGRTLRATKTDIEEKQLKVLESIEANTTGLATGFD